MPNPFSPGVVYYADVPEDGLRDNECRDNPDHGPRPWIVLYSREHKRSGVVIAAPLSTQKPRLASDWIPDPDAFDIEEGRDALFRQGHVRLNQMRALDKSRFDLANRLGHLRRAHVRRLRGNIVGMFEGRRLPDDAPQ